jgi:hypothetical protein
MIEKILIDKYGDYLDGLDIYENKKSLRLSRIIINPDYRNKGIGNDIMNDLINYADANKQIITLTPSSDFGGNENKLRQFYKKFGFKYNKGYHKNYEFNDSMIRYPKLNETVKSNIKTLLREAILKNDVSDKKILEEFVSFAKNFLNIGDKNIKIILTFKRTPDIKTTAYFNPSGEIKIYVKDRAIMDVCRSIAHELTHFKQSIYNELTNTEEDGADGSEIENEANAKAGEIIRKFGRLHPEIYD